jgi:hypothetical protein
VSEPVAPDDPAWLARIAHRVGTVLFGASGPATPERVAEAAEAASWVAARYIDPDTGTIPTDPDVYAGVVVLAVRVYQGPASPAGSLASEAYTGVYVPADLLEHVRHYFDPHRTAGGVA